MQEQAQDAAALLEALDAAPALLVGEGFGALIALELLEEALRDGGPAAAVRASLGRPRPRWPAEARIVNTTPNTTTFDQPDRFDGALASARDAVPRPIASS